MSTRSAQPLRDRTRVGLVLGAGGVAGLAYHAGTLLALEHDLGWDPRSAEVIVGTSAGSIVASLLRSGLSTDDLAAWGSRVTPRGDGRRARSVLESAESAPMPRRAPRPRGPVDGLRLMSSALTGRTRLSTAAMALLPFGPLDASGSLARFGALTDRWPEEPMWIAAVRADNARRVVFGRDATTTVGQAVAASCSIPGLYRPTRIGRHLYIDGGAHSPTSADLLTASDVGVAVVLSPMSHCDSIRGARPSDWMRRRSGALLDRECERLRRAGIEVHVLAPDADTLAAMGRNPLDRRRAQGTLTQSFLSASKQVSPALHDALTQRPSAGGIVVAPPTGTSDALAS